jgi:hypothetical protein
MATRSVNIRYREHLFYTSLAAVFTLTVFVGFSRTYYVKGFFGTPRLSWLAHLHGVVFTLWVLFFLWQTALVATRRISLHRRSGWIGAWFAVGIVTLGAVMAMHSVRLGYASGRPNMPLLLVGSIFDMSLFCVFFAAGLHFRSNTELHKRLMILAMLSLIIPAIARLPIPPGAIAWVIFGLSLSTVLYDALFLRRAYVVNITGVVLINIASPLRFIVAHSPIWQKFAHGITRSPLF